jgi:hypothetical protein
MAITERTIIGSREVLPDGQIQVRTDQIIEKDGVEISRTYHRHVLAPGDSITDQDPSVQRIAMAEHTPAKIAAYKLAREEAENSD